MFKIFKREKKNNLPLPEPAPEELIYATAEKKVSLFSRLKNSLIKTRKTFTDGLTSLLLGEKNIDQNILEEIETYLLTADVGVNITKKIITNITTKLNRKELNDGKAVLDELKQCLIDSLTQYSKKFTVDTNKKPFLVLIVGINGAGKTTSIGKLAHMLQNENKKIMLAAGDTFRAAAVEQLQVWGERNNIPVVAQQHGADSAAVIFDALESAQAKNIDILIADTAGRLHTQEHLMSGLKKVAKVIKKLDASAPHETLLVLDASIGQNALQQASEFNAALKIDGIILTKLDGTAKGGIIFAIVDKLNIPVKFIGLGEGIDDLQPFNAQQFVDALF